MSNRREFIVQFGLIGSAFVAEQSFAQGAMVVESDAQAAALGYKADASKADKAKYPKYAAGQQCDGCALFQGKAGAASGAAGAASQSQPPLRDTATGTEAEKRDSMSS